MPKKATKATKPLSPAGAAMERKLRAWPAGPERDAMRELMKPIGQKMREKSIAERKEIMSWPKERRQEIYAAIQAGGQFGFIAENYGISVWQVTRLYLMNQKKHVYYVPNDVSI